MVNYLPVKSELFDKMYERFVLKQGAEHLLGLINEPGMINCSEIFVLLGFFFIYFPHTFSVICQHLVAFAHYSQL